MKLRLLLTILSLVVVPTALLSLMVNYAIKGREIVIHEQLKTGANNTIRMVSGRIRASIEGEALRIRNTFAGPVAGGADKADIEKTAVSLKSRGLVDNVFLFMNPWGFIYPAEPAPEKGKQREDQPLVGALCRAISVAGPTQASVMLTQNDVSYCFVPFSDRRDLYAGFGIKSDAFRALLDRVLAEFSGKGIVLRAEGPGIDKEGGIVVEDSFGSSRLSAERNDERNMTILASSRLGKPFDHIRITAFLKDTEEMISTGQSRSRLVAWGMLLLAAGICAGIFMVVGRAVTEVRRAAARGEYVIGVSHDLRSPVASMKMLAESLYQDTVQDAEKRKKFLGTIVGECDRLNRLIEKVLFFVRLGQDALIYTMGTVDIGRLVARVAETFFVTSAGESRSDLKPVIKVAPNLPQIDVDENAISQLVLNLLDNAVKYGQKAGGGVSEIRVEVDAVKRKKWFGGRRADRIRIAVTDQGMGISRKDRKKIFRSFYRSMSARNTNLSGVGLGLSLSAHIAKAHGGWIEVESEKGKGSTFSVFLPVRRGKEDIERREYPGSTAQTRLRDTEANNE